MAKQPTPISAPTASPAPAPAPATAAPLAPAAMVVTSTAPGLLPIDASGEATASPLAGVDAALFDATARAEASRLDASMAEALSRAADRLSPPLPGPRPLPLPPVQPFGTKGAAAPDRLVIDPTFDRRSTIERLLAHPSADVRQRAQEAQVAIHHGAADIGIKVSAAMDTARGAESRR